MDLNLPWKKVFDFWVRIPIPSSPKVTHSLARSLQILLHIVPFKNPSSLPHKLHSGTESPSMPIDVESGIIKKDADQHTTRLHQTWKYAQPNQPANRRISLPSLKLTLNIEKSDAVPRLQAAWFDSLIYTKPSLEFQTYVCYNISLFTGVHFFSISKIQQGHFTAKKRKK